MRTETIDKTQQSITCDGCGHPILKDQPVLSDTPEQIPEDFSREAFRHFHIRCHRCGANSTPCYQLYASRQASFTAQANTDCDRCGHPIHAGQDVLRDSFFIWNTTRDAGDTGDKREVSGWIAGASRAHKSAAPTPFNALPSWLKLKFIKAGLGNGRGYRTLAEAEQFYLRSVPPSVRNSGWKGIAKFLKGKDASHIESYANQPGKAGMPRNFVWEPQKWNRSRGSANMTRLTKMRVNASNGAHAARIVGKNALGNALKVTMWAVLLEGWVSTAEGAICVGKGKVSKENAAKKVAVNTAKSSAIAGTTAFGVTVAASLGAAPVLAAMYPVVVPVSVVIYGVSVVQRIQAAMHDPNPLLRVPFYFHTSCSDCGTGLSCFEEFAAEISRPLP